MMSTEQKPMRVPNPYRESLEKLVIEFMKAKIAEARANKLAGISKPTDGPYVNKGSTEKGFLLQDDGTLSDEDARSIHETFCRQQGMDFIQTIDDWNSRSPADDQW